MRTAKGPVQPGAEIMPGFYLADMANRLRTGLALIDNFRRDCDG